MTKHELFKTRVPTDSAVEMVSAAILRLIEFYRTRASRRLLLLLALWPMLSTPARADIYVLESSVPSIKAGAALQDDEQVVLPPGTSIRAVLPSGKTQTLRGPFNGQVKDLAKEVKANEGVLTWLKNLMQSGGTSETPGGLPGRDLDLAHRPGGCPDPPCTKPGQGGESTPTGAAR